MSIRPLRSTSNGKLPRDTVPWDNLALRYEGIGQHEKALANASEAMRLDPRDSYAYQNLGDVYERLTAMMKLRSYWRKPSHRAQARIRCDLRFMSLHSSSTIKAACSAKWRR